MVTRSLRPGEPQDDLGRGQETDRRAGCVRVRMNGFGGVGSRRVVTGAFCNLEPPMGVLIELGRRRRGVGLNIAEGGGRRKWRIYPRQGLSRGGS